MRAPPSTYLSSACCNLGFPLFLLDHDGLLWWDSPNSGLCCCHFERLLFPAGDCQHVQREALGVSNWQKCSVVGFVFGQDQPMTGRRSTSLSMLLWASLHTCEGHHPLEDTTSLVEEWCWSRDGPWCKKRSVEKKKEGENTAYTPLCPHPWGQQTMVFTVKEKQPQLWATFLTFYPVSW